MVKILIAFFVLTAFTLKAQPVMNGGLEAFVKANHVYPRYSLHNCIQGTVTISFKINKDGVVYFSKINSGIGTDLDDEALRLIRMSSGKWKVPPQHDTVLNIVAPIKFSLSGYSCGDKDPKEIDRAILAYRTNAALSNSILNFYKRMETGDYRKEDEARFVALKYEMGYDEEYFRERINDGQKKLKQKDIQGACEDFSFVKYMGSSLADEMLAKYCK